MALKTTMHRAVRYIASSSPRPRLAKCWNITGTTPLPCLKPCWAVRSWDESIPPTNTGFHATWFVYDRLYIWLAGRVLPCGRREIWNDTFKAIATIASFP